MGLEKVSNRRMILISMTILFLLITSSAMSIEVFGGARASGASFVETRGSVIINVSTGIGSEGIAFDSSNGNLYVANTAGYVSVINGTTNKDVANITIGNSTQPSKQPGEILYAEGYLYVSEETNDSVAIISDKNDTVVNTLRGIGELYFPHGLAYDSSTGYVYVTGTSSSSVTAIYQQTIINNILFDSAPYYIAFDSSNGNLYVTFQTAARVSVIDGFSNTVVSNISTGFWSTSHIAYGDGLIYVSSNNNSESVPSAVSVINGSTNKVILTIEGLGTNLAGLAYDSNSHYAYLISPDKGILYAINATTVFPYADIPKGSNSVSFDPFNNYLYVTSANGVSVVAPSGNSTTTSSSYTSTPTGSSTTATTTSSSIASTPTGSSTTATTTSSIISTPSSTGSHTNATQSSSASISLTPPSIPSNVNIYYYAAAAVIAVASISVFVVFRFFRKR